jgi:GT2 family glycosyltransferase
LLPDAARRVLTPQFWSHDREAEIDCVLGAALAIRAEVFHAIGGFWPKVYGEEHDLGYRLQRRGYRVIFDPSARVMHIGNHSLAQRWSDAERAAIVARAELAFLDEHYPRGRRALIRAILWCAWQARAIGLRGLRRPARAAVYASLAREYFPGGRHARSS